MYLYVSGVSSVFLPSLLPTVDGNIKNVSYLYQSLNGPYILAQNDVG